MTETVKLDTAAEHWRQYYDGRAEGQSLRHFMQVLGYHPDSGGDYGRLFDGILAEIEARLALESEHIFLDIACGFAAFTRRLAATANLAVGTDLAAALLKQGRGLESEPGMAKLCGIVQANGCAQPFVKASFDRILCFGVFFHLSRADAATVVEEIVRLLRPGGRALIGDVLHPARLQRERSYIEKVPALLHAPLRWGLRCKAIVDRLRGKVVYQAYAPKFFARILPSGFTCRIYEDKADGRRNNRSRYDVVIERG